MAEEEEGPRPESLTGSSTGPKFVLRLASREHLGLYSQRHSFNPHVTSGLTHPYYLDESTFIFRGVRSNMSFSFHFSMKFMY